MHQIHTKHAKISEKVLHIPSNKIVVSFKKIHRSKNKEQTDLIPTAQDPQRDPTDLDTTGQDPTEEVVGKSVGDGGRSVLLGGGREKQCSGRPSAATAGGVARDPPVLPGRQRRDGVGGEAACVRPLWRRPTGCQG
jgi:hypothetical protein